MECLFLKAIDYNLYIKSSDYAKYYYILRVYIFFNSNMLKKTKKVFLWDQLICPLLSIFKKKLNNLIKFSKNNLKILLINHFFDRDKLKLYIYYSLINLLNLNQVIYNLKIS
jgi:hypothetical protein